MTKNQEELLALLGDDYHMEVVDYEDCICRDIGMYSIEISGTASRTRPYNVYVWERLPGGGFKGVTETFLGIKNDGALRATLDEIVARLTGNLPR